MEPVILDIEASGFGRGSYPIEIGLALPYGETYSVLIRPIENWTHWDDNAEKLHGISREQLMLEGISIVDVANQLNELLEGYPVYSDGWGFDSTWLSLLYYEAGKQQAFKLDALARIMSEGQMSIWDETKLNLRQASGYTAHRAGPDAQLLQKTWLKTKRLTKSSD